MITRIGVPCHTLSYMSNKHTSTKFLQVFLGVSCERVSVPLAHTCHQSDAKYIDGTCGADLLKVGTRKPTTICVLIIIILRPSKTGGTGVISMKINY